MRNSVVKALLKLLLGIWTLLTVSACTLSVSIVDKNVGLLHEPSLSPTPTPTPPVTYKTGADTTLVNEATVGRNAGSAVTTTSSRDYYVDVNSGDDANPGSAASPWKTLGHAVSVAAAGERILIQPGVYRESVVLTQDGTAGAPIVIEAADAAHPPDFYGSDITTGWLSAATSEYRGTVSAGFENNDLAELDGFSTEVDVGGIDSIATTNTAAMFGTRSLALQFGGGQDLAKVGRGYTPSLPSAFLRAYVKLNSSFQMTGTSRKTLLTLRDSARGINIFSISLKASCVQPCAETYSLMATSEHPKVVAEIGGVAPVTLTGSTQAISKDHWYLLEIGGVVNGASSELRFSITDAQTSTVLKNMTRTVDWTADPASDCDSVTAGFQACEINRVYLGGGSTAPGTTTMNAGSVLYFDQVRVDSAAIGAFVAGPGSLYFRRPVSWSVWQVFQDGTFIPNITNLTPYFADRYAADQSYVENIPNGSFYSDSTKKLLYLKPTDGTIAGHTLEVGRGKNSPQDYQGILGDGRSYYIIKGLKFHHYSKENSGAIRLLNSHHFTITECEFSDNYGSGVLIRNSSHDNRVLRNFFQDNAREFGGGVRIDMKSYDNIVEYNTFQNTTDYTAISTDTSGVGLLGYVSGTLPSTFDFTEHVGGNAVFLRYNGDDSNPGGFGPPERNIIRYNRMNHLLDTGVYLAEEVNNTEVYGNIISNIFASKPWGNSGGNGLHIAKHGMGTKAYNNIIYNIETSAFNIRYGSGDNEIYNNTIYRTGLKSFWLPTKVSSGVSIQGPTSTAPTAPGSYGNKVYNNIVHSATGYCLEADPESVATGTNSLDNNVCYNPTGRGNYLWSGTEYSTIAEAAAAGLQTHGMNADPQFTSDSLLTPDFTLLPGSPALSCGRLWP